MKFQEGDKVVVVSTGEKGFVVEWINKKMLTIDVDGVRFPVYADQIDFTYFNDFTSTQKHKPNKLNKAEPVLKPEKKVIKSVERDGLWVSYFPVLDKDVFDEDVISHFRIYLLNHSDDALLLTFQVYYGSDKHFEIKHTIRSLEELYLFDLPLENLNDQPLFQFLFEVPDHPEKGQHTVTTKLRPKQIFTMAENVLNEQKASFRIHLFKQFEGVEQSLLPEDQELPEKGIDLAGLSSAGFKVRAAKKK